LGLLRLFLPVCFLPIFAGTTLRLFFSFLFLFSLLFYPTFLLLYLPFFSLSYVEPMLKVEYCKLWLIEGEGSLGSKNGNGATLKGKFRRIFPPFMINGVLPTHIRCIYIIYIVS
jgi:hypothetical protein